MQPHLLYITGTSISMQITYHCSLCGRLFPPNAPLVDDCPGYTPVLVIYGKTPTFDEMPIGIPFVMTLRFTGIEYEFIKYSDGTMIDRPISGLKEFSPHYLPNGSMLHWTVIDWFFEDCESSNLEKTCSHGQAGWCRKCNGPTF